MTTLSLITDRVTVALPNDFFLPPSLSYASLPSYSRIRTVQPPIRKARLLVTPSRGSPGSALTSEQAQLYFLSPAQITVVKEDLAALVLSRITSARVNEVVLRTRSAGRGAAMLNLLQECSDVQRHLPRPAQWLEEQHRKGLLQRNSEG